VRLPTWHFKVVVGVGRSDSGLFCRQKYGRKLVLTLGGKRFEDPDYPEKVYKVVKALYRLNQAPRAWYETLANYLLENSFQRGKIDQTLFIKRQKDGKSASTPKDTDKPLLKDPDVKQKKDGIFISQDKYVAEILRKFRLTDTKSASTPIDTEKPLLKDPDGKGFSGVDTPLFEGMIVAQQADDVANEGAASVDVDVVPAVAVEPSIPSPTPTTQPPPPSQELPSTSQVLPTPPLSPIAQPPSPQQQPQPSQPLHDAKISMDLLHIETYTTLIRRVKHLEQDKIAQTLEITKLKQRGDIIANMDADEDVTLKDAATIAKEVAVEKDDDIEENADV
nr:hypothetical protein [Tanacetum cinerariifolium]